MIQYILGRLKFETNRKLRLFERITKSLIRKTKTPQKRNTSGMKMTGKPSLRAVNIEPVHGIFAPTSIESRRTPEEIHAILCAIGLEIASFPSLPKRPKSFTVWRRNLAKLLVGGSWVFFQTTICLDGNTRSNNSSSPKTPHYLQ